MSENPETPATKISEYKRWIIIGAVILVVAVVVILLLPQIRAMNTDKVDSLEMTTAEIDAMVEKAVTPYDPEVYKDELGLVFLHKTGPAQSMGKSGCIVEATEYGDTYCYIDDWKVEIRATEEFDWVCSPDVQQFSAVVRRAEPTSNTGYDVIHLVEPVSYDALVESVVPLEKYADRCAAYQEVDPE